MTCMDETGSEMNRYGSATSGTGLQSRGFLQIQNNSNNNYCLTRKLWMISWIVTCYSWILRKIPNACKWLLDNVLYRLSLKTYKCLVLQLVTINGIILWNWEGLNKPLLCTIEVNPVIWNGHNLATRPLNHFAIFYKLTEALPWRPETISHVALSVFPLGVLP